MTILQASQPAARNRLMPGLRVLAWRRWLLLAVVFVAAALLRQFVAANTDVSWLLTVGERVLDGQRLYADIIETNPPMAVLAYLPGIALARAVGMPPELIVDSLVFAGIAASLLASCGILRRSTVLDGISGWPLLIVAAAVLAILPMQTFGQREHLAVIALLPALAAFAIRSRREQLEPWAIVVAGVGAGLALTFKPQFAIPIGLGIAIAAIASRSWRTLFAPENMIAAAVVVVYGIATALIVPEYFAVIVPMLRDVYIPLGRPLAELLVNDATLVWSVALLTAVALRRDALPSALLIPVAASIGFAAVYLIQRKGWAYHSYPMIAFALIALGYAVLSGQIEQARRTLGLVTLPVLLVVAMPWFNTSFDARGLELPIARLGPHPKILVLTAEPGIGHPLVRNLHGVWVSRQQGLWIDEYVRRLRRGGTIDPQTDARLSGYLERERAGLIADFRDGQPGVVLVDNLTTNWTERLRNDAELTALLKSYQRVETVSGIDILKRIDKSEQRR